MRRGREKLGLFALACGQQRRFAATTPRPRPSPAEHAAATAAAAAIANAPAESTRHWLVRRAVRTTKTSLRFLAFGAVCAAAASLRTHGRVADALDADWVDADALPRSVRDATEEKQRLLQQQAAQKAAEEAAAQKKGLFADSGFFALSKAAAAKRESDNAERVRDTAERAHAALPASGVAAAQAAALRDPFSPASVPLDATLHRWDDIAPTLRKGDLLFLKGTGRVSWQVASACHLLSGLNYAALRFSHIAVVIGADPKTGAVEILEAVDNRDIRAMDARDRMRFRQVQQVNAATRIFGRDGERAVYSRCAVRRLQGFEWTPEREAALAAFVAKNEGRPLLHAVSLGFAIVGWPEMYRRWRRWTHRPAADATVSTAAAAATTAAPTTAASPAVAASSSAGAVDAACLPERGRPEDEISCSELVGDLYRAVGVLDPLRQPADCVALAPYNFAEGGDRGWLAFAPGVSLGPETRVAMPPPAVPAAAVAAAEAAR